jgi:hypothetical protein
MSLRTSNKSFLLFVLFLILLFFQLTLSFSLAFNTSPTEGISALEACEEDSVISPVGEPGISEEIYSVPCINLITAFEKQEEDFIITLTPLLLDKPPGI